LRTLRLTLLLAGHAVAFQVFQPPKSALERPGLHHTDIQGRFVSDTGEPVPGVHVHVHGIGPWQPVLASTESGADGRFFLHDIDARHAPELRWFPPERWLQGRTALIGESGQAIDVGTIRLREDTVIRVTVEVVGGPPLAPQDRDPSVFLEANGRFGPRVWAMPAQGYRVLRQIPFDEGKWAISLFANRRSEEYEAPIHIQRGRRDQLFHIRLLRDTLEPKDFRSTGKMEIQESVIPPITLEKEYRAEGTVLAPDGSPIAGAFLSVNDSSSPQLTVTGADGRFQLSYRSTSCREPSAHLGGGHLLLGSARNDTLSDEACRQQWTQPRDLVARLAARLSILTPGVDAGKAQAFWWDQPLGWQKFPSLEPWVSLVGNDVSIKLEAEGHLPLMRRVTLPHLNWNAKESPLEALAPVEFRLLRSHRRELRVRGGGRPIRGATVDVELITDLTRNQRQPLTTLRTPADGRIKLASGEDSLIEVFIYAEGFEPARAIWNAGRALTVNLVPRNATFSFAPHPALSVARLRETRSPHAIRTVRIQENQPASIRMMAGTYDITVYDSSGLVAGYQRQALLPNETKQIDPRLDQRPRLTIRYPASTYSDNDWQARISASTPQGGSIGWTTWAVNRGSLAFDDVPAVTVSQLPTETVFLLSHAGRMHLELRRPRTTLSLWREVDLKPGESITLELPPTNGTIRGSMRTYEQEPGSAHGFAGPRLQLISDDPAGWSATEYLPGSEDGGIVIRGIPAGRYHLHQHLIGEPRTRPHSPGIVHKYQIPVDAWGGIPVEILPGGTARLKDFIDYPFRDLTVEVRDAGGRPLKNATVRVRDRMSEAWRIIEENPAQVRQAAHPIPYPPAVRLVNGTATIPRIRSGWLELSVELDNGGGYHFKVPIGEDGRLSLKLPRI
jgi:hypothetical protein